jgi:hypothetical protein
MKTRTLFAVLTTFCLLVMIGVDYLIGSHAEFLYAWSVLERLFGKTPTAGESMVFQSIGAAGELVCVLAINAAIGALLTLVIRFVSGKLRDAP